MTIPRAVRRAFIGALIVAFAAGAVALWRTGSVTVASVRAWLDALGPAAPALFLAAFVGGAFVGMPGITFVVAGRLVFGPWLGFVLGYAGGLLAVTLPFLAARMLGRRAVTPWQPRNRHVRRAYAMLETHPFTAVLLLRLVVWFNPPLSYALALTTIRLRVYLAACALALVPVVALAMVATSWFL